MYNLIHLISFNEKMWKKIFSETENVLNNRERPDINDISSIFIFFNWLICSSAVINCSS